MMLKDVMGEKAFLFIVGVFSIQAAASQGRNHVKGDICQFSQWKKSQFPCI